MKKEKEKENKTIIYIDASNIILSIKSLNLEIDFNSFKKYLSDRFRTNEIYYFTPNLDILKENIINLKNINYKVILKDTYYQNKLKANCDVEIAHFITKNIKDKILNRLVLISGDGDFSILLDYANENNILVNVLSVNKKSTAKLLRKKKYFKVEYIFNHNKILSKNN